MPDSPRIGATLRWIAALAICLLALLSLLFFAIKPSCPPDVNGETFLVCGEAWLYRYQTLIGAIVAIGAAALAWLGLQSQVRAADAQFAISAFKALDAQRNTARSMQIALNDSTRVLFASLHQCEQAERRVDALYRHYKNDFGSINIRELENVSEILRDQSVTYTAASDAIVRFTRLRDEIVLSSELGAFATEVASRVGSQLFEVNLWAESIGKVVEYASDSDADGAKRMWLEVVVNDFARKPAVDRIIQPQAFEAQARRLDRLIDDTLRKIEGSTDRR